MQNRTKDNEQKKKKPCQIFPHDLLLPPADVRSSPILLSNLRKGQKQTKIPTGQRTRPRVPYFITSIQKALGWVSVFKEGEVQGDLVPLGNKND